MFLLQKSEDLEYFRAGIYDRFTCLRHAFSTRHGGVSKGPYKSLNLGFSVGDRIQSVEQNRSRFYALFDSGMQEVALGQQVHGSRIQEIDNGGCYESCDGFLTRQPGMLLTIQTADCAGVILYDPAAPVLALLHTGWRGLVDGIIEKGIKLMSERFASKPEQLMVAVSPAIHACCYEIRSDVARHFGDNVECHNRAKFLDLPGAIERRLLQQGVNPHHIDICQLCTACQPELFFSHRRDGSQTGRMMTGAMLLER